MSQDRAVTNRTVLLDGVKVRNSIIHGYQDPPAYGALLNKLQHFTQQLLSEELPVVIY